MGAAIFQKGVRVRATKKEIRKVKTRKEKEKGRDWRVKRKCGKQVKERQK
jgi:hypothetical protein